MTISVPTSLKDEVGFNNNYHSFKLLSLNLTFGIVIKLIKEIHTCSLFHLIYRADIAQLQR